LVELHVKLPCRAQKTSIILKNKSIILLMLKSTHSILYIIIILSKSIKRQNFIYHRFSALSW